MTLDFLPLQQEVSPSLRYGGAIYQSVEFVYFHDEGIQLTNHGGQNQNSCVFGLVGVFAYFFQFRGHNCKLNEEQIVKKWEICRENLVCSIKISTAEIRL